MTHDELEDELLEKIAIKFEENAMAEIKSNQNSFNDCAVRAKMWLHAAEAVRHYKIRTVKVLKNDPR